MTTYHSDQAFIRRLLIKRPIEIKIQRIIINAIDYEKLEIWEIMTMQHFINFHSNQIKKKIESFFFIRNLVEQKHHPKSY